MRLKKYAFIALLLVLSFGAKGVGAQGLLEESAPTVAQVYDSKIQEAVALSATILGRMLEGDLTDVMVDVEAIANYVTESEMSNEQKRSLKVQLDSMSALFNLEGEALVTPVMFLLAANQTHKELNDFMYEQPDISTPAYMYQLQYTARKLQFQVLAGDWESIEEVTSENLLDLVSDVYKNLEDPTVWDQTIRPINKSLMNGVDAQDVTAVYAAGQAYLNAAPLIETATLKKVAKQAEVEKQQATEKKNTILIFGSIVVLLIGFLFFFLRRRKV